MKKIASILAVGFGLLVAGTAMAANFHRSEVAGVYYNVAGNYTNIDLKTPYACGGATTVSFVVANGTAASQEMAVKLATSALLAGRPLDVEGAMSSGTCVLTKIKLPN